MFNFIKKLLSSKESTKHSVWEELTEKQTTKWWYFLLVIMFFAIIRTWQRTISIIQDIPDKPNKPPYCLDKVINTFENKNNHNYFDVCSFYELTSLHPKFDFTSEYNKIEDDYKKIINLKQDIDNLESTIKTKEIQLQNYQENYNTSLNEDIANEKDKVYDKKDIQDNIQKLYEDIESIKQNITLKESQIVSLINKNKNSIDNLKEKLKSTKKEYEKLYLVYKIYVALLSFVFTILVFTVVYKIYSRLKKENSPYSIIFSVASFAYGLLFLQVLIRFLLDIIPKKFVEYIISFLSTFEPAIYLIQFLWPVLIVWVFGFMVYKIQKRLYSKENIIKNFIAEKRCPNCGNKVDIRKPYCPLCSNEIQIKCPHCKKLTVKWMPYCSNCWKKLTNKDNSL